MSRADDIRSAMWGASDAVEQLEQILRGEEGAIVFAPDPNLSRAHRHPITDADLTVVCERSEARILLPAFRRLRAMYERSLRPTKAKARRRR